MVDPDSGRVPRAPPYSGTASWRAIGFAYAAVTLSGRPSQAFPLPMVPLSLHGSSPCGPTTPLHAVWAPPLSLAATRGISGGSRPFLISFPELLRWFTSLSMAPAAYFIRLPGACLTACGLPHSAIRGSSDICSYPRLFAAYHGLPRLPAPRHPP